MFEGGGGGAWLPRKKMNEEILKAKLAGLEKENEILQKKIERLTTALEKKSIRGWKVYSYEQDGQLYFRAYKRVDGKNYSVHIGTDKNKAEEKINKKEADLEQKN